MDQKTQKGDYVFLSFRVENHRPSKDVTVTVNGVRNKLSSTATEYYNGNEVFHYTLALPEGTQRLSISFGAGDYEIRKLACCYTYIYWSMRQKTGRCTQIRQICSFPPPEMDIRSDTGRGRSVADHFDSLR